MVEFAFTMMPERKSLGDTMRPPLRSTECELSELATFLKARQRVWLLELKVQMQASAEALDFERAAHFRDLSEALKRTISNHTGIPKLGQKREI